MVSKVGLFARSFAGKVLSAHLPHQHHHHLPPQPDYLVVHRLVFILLDNISPNIIGFLPIITRPLTRPLPPVAPEHLAPHRDVGRDCS